MVWVYAFLAVLAVSLVSFVGALALTLSRRTLERALLYLVALAAGTLIGDALLHLLPHNAEEFGFSLWTGVSILAGVLLLFVVERYVHWHHCHHSHLCEDPHGAGDHSDHVKPFGWTVLLGDAMHNLLDGALIAAAFLLSIPAGVATTLAVLLHEIPQEIADFGVLLHAGFSRTKALLVNFASALTALLGAGVVLVASTAFEALEQYLVPLTAGAFLYIAIADLLPELRHEEELSKSLLHFGTFLLGVVLMAALLFLE